MDADYDRRRFRDRDQPARQGTSGAAQGKAWIARISLADGSVTTLATGYGDYAIGSTFTNLILRWYRGRLNGVPMAPSAGAPMAYALH